MIISKSPHIRSHNQRILKKENVQINRLIKQQKTSVQTLKAAFSFPSTLEGDNIWPETLVLPLL